MSDPAHDDLAHTASGVALMLGWFTFALVYAIRPRARFAREKRRDHSSLAGIALEAAGFALVWGLRGPQGLFGASAAVRAALAALVLAIVSASTWMAAAAVRTLGKQWSVTARVLDDHQLVVSGPYSIVRHPIYAAIFGMLIATGLVLSTWPALVAGATLYLVGTWIRVKSEERLLRGIFGEQYDLYAKRVPAFLPLPRPR